MRAQQSAHIAPPTFPRVRPAPTPRLPAPRSITKGGQQFNWQNTPDSKKAWISAISASGACLLSIVIGIPLLKRKVAADLEEEER